LDSIFSAVQIDILFSEREREILWHNIIAPGHNCFRTRYESPNGKYSGIRSQYASRETQAIKIAVFLNRKCSYQDCELVHRILLGKNQTINAATLARVIPPLRELYVQEDTSPEMLELIEIVLNLES